jgi:hypothetical protein
MARMTLRRELAEETQSVDEHGNSDPVANMKNGLLEELLKAKPVTEEGVMNRIEELVDVLMRDKKPIKIVLIKGAAKKYVGTIVPIAGHA